MVFRGLFGENSGVAWTWRLITDWFLTSDSTPGEDAENVHTEFHISFKRDGAAISLKIAQDSVQDFCGTSRQD